MHMEKAFEFVRYTNLIIHDTKALSAHSCSPNGTGLVATWQSSHTAVNRHKVRGLAASLQRAEVKTDIITATNSLDLEWSL